MNILLRPLVLCLFPGFLWSQVNTDSSIVFIFTGDLNFAHAFETANRHRPIDVFAHWKDIGTYDCMMVNLENAVTRSIDSVEKEFVFKMQPEFLSQFIGAGITIVNCANNHTADFGVEGILETIHQLDSAGIQHVGVGENFSDARKPVIYSKNDLRIGFVGYGGVKDFIAERKKPGTNSRNEKYIIKDIRKLKPQVDLIVVSLHWGEELETEPDQYQIGIARRIIDSGADLIIGHHPHVVQGIERYHGKIIAYSLGNFVFGGNANSANSETAVLKVTITKSTMDVRVIPVRVRNWQPEPAKSQVARRILRRLEDRSKIFKETISFSQ
jgi:poly-gamma-glutamate capsule biosynthesis protein CapA/YwtB (metallophosphatase superfamily)